MIGPIEGNVLGDSLDMATKDSSSQSHCQFVCLSTGKACTRSPHHWGFCDRHVISMQCKRARKQRFYTPSSHIKIPKLESAKPESKPPSTPMNSPIQDPSPLERSAAVSDTNLPIASLPTVPVVSKEPAAEPIVQKPKQLILSKNAFGHYEDRDTHFVFQKETKSVIGVQQQDGTIADLTEEHIKICQSRRWKYIVPDISASQSHESEPKEEISDDDEDIHHLKKKKSVTSEKKVKKTKKTKAKPEPKEEESQKEESSHHESEAVASDQDEEEELLSDVDLDDLDLDDDEVDEDEDEDEDDDEEDEVDEDEDPDA